MLFPLLAIWAFELFDSKAHSEELWSMCRKPKGPVQVQLCCIHSPVIDFRLHYLVEKLDLIRFQFGLIFFSPDIMLTYGMDSSPLIDRTQAERLFACCHGTTLRTRLFQRGCSSPAMACGSEEYSCTSRTPQSRDAFSFFSLEADGATLKRPCSPHTGNTQSHVIITSDMRRA